MEKVTVVVLTYNPVMSKLCATLRSIIAQQFIDLEIVISDDGSKNFSILDIEQFFKRYSYSKYKIVRNAKNEGTVINALKGLSVVSGEYVKLISPGDMFTSQFTLHSWVTHLKESGKKWSISDALFYRLINNDEISLVQKEQRPREISIYIKDNLTKCRWNYIMMDDVALGAAIISERKVLYDYLKRIEGKVIYAEDNIYRLMMFDGICADYFPENAILYEYGEGISTQKSDFWNIKIKKDWEETNSEMLNRINPGDKLQRKMIKYLKRRKYQSGFMWFMNYITEPGRIEYVLRKRYIPRLSQIIIPDELKEVNWYAHN